VEDEAAVRRFLRPLLTLHGYRLVEAETGEEAISLAAQYVPDLVLLDLGLPDVDGLEVTRRLRRESQVPIIVLSARGQESDKVAALDAGADDYVTKPFGSGELLARLRVTLRHAARLGAGGGSTEFATGPMCVDLVARRVTVNGAEVRLTAIEYKLLAALVEHAGAVVTHRQLLREVWGPGHAADTQYLRVYVAHLRRKLERDPARPAVIRTEIGVGYRLLTDEPAPEDDRSGRPFNPPARPADADG
jgi:two-component system KDP operon response regulator KdpE